MHNVLIVDDESGIRQSLQGILEDEGYRADVAESGEACLQSLQQKKFDVVLLDIWLPGLDGLEILAKIRDLENALFGHTRSWCPAATSDKEGKFQRAHGGTLFLDEIGDMSLKTQSKVLRTLDEQRITPVGSSEPVTVDVRVIASTNKDLEEEISHGNFREDLFYRLNVIPFSVPPLRERQEDVPLLARYFLKEFSAAYGRRPREITDDAIETLMRYSWPGNVREIRNVIERIVIMNPTTTRFDRKHLPPLVHRDGSRRSGGQEFSTLHQARAAYERDYILKKLDENHGNISRTAEVLGLERSHLYRKMKTLGIAVRE